MSEAYLGEIRLFAGDYAPRDWHLCNGSLLPISQYEALFSLIGTTYGGDGVTTFGLPDMRGRMVVGMGTNPMNGFSYDRGRKAGQEAVTLTPANLPVHMHAASASANDAVTDDPKGTVWAKAPVNTYSTAPATATMLDPSSVSVAAGGNQPHENRQPSMALSYIIALVGTYPQQQQ